MQLKNAAKVYGIDFDRFRHSVRGVPKFICDYIRFRKQRRNGWPVTLKPFLSDYRENSGQITQHYFKQDIYVARQLLAARPNSHVDIGSRLDGFISHVAVFMPVDVIDIRDNKIVDKHIRFRRADICMPPAELTAAYDSLSCLHTIEHIGLGRYGDPVDFDGWLAALDGMMRLLRVGGTAYLSAPIGRKRVEFNAQRVFDVSELVHEFGLRGSISKISLIDDEDVLTEGAELNQDQVSQCQNWKFGCAIVTIQKTQ